MKPTAMSPCVAATFLFIGCGSDAPLVPDSNLGRPSASNGTEQECFIAAGAFDARLTTTTGETFWGEAINSPGFVDADWAHTAEGFDFQSFDRAIDVTCTTNSIVQGIIDGFGVVNDELGYLYTVSIIDEIESDIVLESSGTDASTSFASPTTVEIPAALEVTSGAAGPGLVWIRFDDMKCFYSANSSGDAYVFSRCEDRSLSPGDTLDVTSVQMHVAGSSTGPLTVSANLTGDSGSGSGAVDQYSISVWDEVTLELVYSFSGTLAAGDIVITLN